MTVLKQKIYEINIYRIGSECYSVGHGVAPNSAFVGAIPSFKLRYV